ncbi:hypothetical protein [Parafilimonas sp.]|uniref:hypothetical protein n=1 Tax=Parafilimonas sp. TaxID=1969739 RepID=UPI003F812F27
MKPSNFLLFLLGSIIVILFTSCVAELFAGEAIAGSEIIEGASLETIVAEEPEIAAFERGFKVENEVIIIQDVTEVNKNLSRVFIQNNNELWIKSEKGNIKIANVLDENKINLVNAGEVTLPGNLYYTKGNGINVRMGPGNNYEAYASKTIRLENGQLVLIRRVSNSNWWILPMGKDRYGKNIYGYVDSSNLLPIIIKTNNSAYDNGQLDDCKIKNTGDICFTNKSSSIITIYIDDEKIRDPNTYEGYRVPILTLEPNETSCAYNISARQHSIHYFKGDKYNQTDTKFKQISVKICASADNINPVELK